MISIHRYHRYAHALIAQRIEQSPSKRCIMVRIHVRVPIHRITDHKRRKQVRVAETTVETVETIETNAMSDFRPDFTLQRLADDIYLVTSDEQFDVSMLFLRPQEFYECPTDVVRSRPFELVRYMRWFSVEWERTSLRRTRGFTYHCDWVGFNLPSHILDDMYAVGVPDVNIYDRCMSAIYETIKSQRRRCDNHGDGDSKRFYILGVVTGGSALQHELAHALWYVNDTYKTRQMANIDALEHRTYDEIRKAIVTEGYLDRDDIIVDEMQAYMSTGISGHIEANLSTISYTGRRLKRLLRPFVDTYDEFVNTLGFDTPKTMKILWDLNRL